jgi:hypothetical protein
MGRMLKAVTTGRQKAPLRELVYGVEGVGKTTFGAEAPSPIFLGEDGTKRLDVARFPVARSWSDVTDAVLELGREKHDYRTLVVDTLDHLEGLAFAAVCAREERSSIADVPYNKGPDYALDFWRSLLQELEQLQAKTGMNVILLAHAAVKTFKNPMGDDWDRFTLKINEKAAALVRGWAESVLFASYDVSVKKAAKRDTKGKAEGVARYLYTQRVPAADAKNRYDLPPRIELSFAEFARFMERGDSERALTMRQNAQELLEQVLDATRKARAGEALAKAGDDLKALRSVVSRLAATIEEQDQAAAAEPAGASPAVSERVAPTAAAPSAVTPTSTPPSAAGHADERTIPALAPERQPAPASGGARSPGEGGASSSAPSPSPPPAAIRGEPVTVAEVLAWIGDANVAHAETAVRLLADASSSEPSETPAIVARLIRASGRVEGAVLLDWWRAVGGTFTQKGVVVRGVRVPDFAPLSAEGFARFWHEKVRAHVSEESIAEAAGVEFAPEGV